MRFKKEDEDGRREGNEVRFRKIGDKAEQKLRKGR